MIFAFKKTGWFKKKILFFCKNSYLIDCIYHEFKPLPKYANAFILSPSQLKELRNFIDEELKETT